MSSILLLVRRLAPRNYRLQHTKAQIQVQNLLAPLFGHLRDFPDQVAITDEAGQYSYGNLLLSARNLAQLVQEKCSGKSGERVLFLCPNNTNYVVTLWAIWMAGQIGVPLSPMHPNSSHLYYANDTGCSLIISTQEYAEKMHKIASNTNAKLLVLDEKLQETTSGRSLDDYKADLEEGFSTNLPEQGNALILYTSGTTGHPKGVVLTHRNLTSQVNCLLEAWHWSKADVLLHTLPLHHTHGIVNALLCPLCVGAKIVMLPKFSAKNVWSHLLNVNNEGYISVFMAVPTMYSLLLKEYEIVFGSDHKMIDYIQHTLKTRCRLMVSGSAPLSTPIFNQWLKVSGHRLLERYGMTEMGMCLSNSYETPSDREPGFIGVPLPGVTVQLVDEEGVTNFEARNSAGKILAQQRGPGTVGELAVKGDNVFKQYYNRPEATKAAFALSTQWFSTGDVCEYSLEKKKFRLLGRRNTDILKVGGHKVSALEIEMKFMENERVADCMVAGLDDETWGQIVCTLIVLKPMENEKEKSTVSVEELLEWATTVLPKYQVPKKLQIVEKIPKNQMGKVNKKEVVAQYFLNPTK